MTDPIGSFLQAVGLTEGQRLKQAVIDTATLDLA